MIEPPKRRWFQFSLRTLLIVVTLLALPLVYVGRQVGMVKERKALRANNVAFFYKAIDMVYFEREKYPVPATIPWIRERLGDEAIQVVRPRPSANAKTIAELKAAFPEAEFEQ
jgi:hypothetical protein